MVYILFFVVMGEGSSEASNSDVKISEYLKPLGHQLVLKKKNVNLIVSFCLSLEAVVVVTLFTM